MVPCRRIDRVITWWWCARETTSNYRKLIQPIPHSTVCSTPSGSHPPPTVLSYSPRKNSILGREAPTHQKKKPVDGKLQETKPRAQSAGNMVNYRPFFPISPTVFTTDPYIPPHSIPATRDTFSSRPAISRYRQVFRPQPRKEHGRKETGPTKPNAHVRGLQPPQRGDT